MKTKPSNEKNTRSSHLLRLTLIFGAVASIATLAIGCGDGGNSPSTSEPAQATAAPKEIFITGNDQMQFSKTEFTVKAGESVRVIFKNVGTMPKESMGHDWLLLKDTANADQFVEDGFAFASNEYIAPEHKDEVLAHTKITGPGETVTVVFTAPTKTGPYDYVCTFPGHFAAGMKGVMTVE